MPTDPITLFCMGAITQMASGIAGNRADGVFCNVMQRTADHFISNARLPENHDLLKGMATAFLQSFRYYAETVDGQTRGPADRIIADKIGALAKNDLRLDGDIATSLIPMVTPLIAGAGDIDSNVRREQLIDATVTGLIEWIENEAGEKLPAHFRSLFTEVAPNGRAPWIAAFRLCLSEEIKNEKKERYHRIFVASNVAELVGRAITIESLARDLADGLDGLRGDLGLVAADVKLIASDVKDVLTGQLHLAAGIDELLAYVRQGSIVEKAAEQGISEAAVRKVVEFLGERDLAKQDLIPWLEGWVRSAKEQLGRHSNEGAAFDEAVAEAKRLFRVGQMDDVSDPLLELERLEEEDSKRRRIAMLQKAIDLDVLALNIDKAMDTLLNRLAPVACGGNSENFLAFFIELYQQQMDDGQTNGNSGALIFAAEICRQVLLKSAGTQEPNHRGAFHLLMGDALSTLGERESGTARLEQSVSAYRLALDGFPRHQYPAGWSAIQNSLGVALLRLGERQIGTEILEEAVLAFEAALEESDPDHSPKDWAKANLNLSSALMCIGARINEQARIEDAIAASNKALSVYSPDEESLAWSNVKLNIANALKLLALLNNDICQLEEALSVCQSVDGVIDRKKYPFDWAAIEITKGNLLKEIGLRKKTNIYFEQSVKIYENALNEYDKNKNATGWAIATSNLAESYMFIAAISEEIEGLDRAERLVAAARDIFVQGGNEAQIARADETLERIRMFREALQEGSDDGLM